MYIAMMAFPIEKGIGEIWDSKASPPVASLAGEGREGATYRADSLKED
jgi:hypothetical protein